MSDKKEIIVERRILDADGEMRAGGPAASELAPATGSASMFDSLEPSEIHTVYMVLDMFKALAKCRRTIGRTAIGQHPDEINPRAETWMKERENLETEVAMLRKRVSDLEARLNDQAMRPEATKCK